MTKLTLKRGQSALITFGLTDAAGAPYDLTGCVVTLAADGGGRSFRRVGVVPSPLTGAGSFTVDAADYATLVPGTYKAEVWATKAGVRDPLLSLQIVVVDVPQVT